MNSSEIIKSLNKLNADQEALWGKMTPHHMVEHLYKTFQASINEIPLTIYSEERKIPILKRLFLGDRELPKEFMNPAIGSDLMKLEFDDLPSAIKELENILKRYERFFKDNPTIKTAHPVFGNCNKEEWDIFHLKHIKHHCSQFGLNVSQI